MFFGTATSMCFCILFFACLSFEMWNVILWVKDVWHMLSAIGKHSPCIWCAWWHHGQLFVMYATLSLRLCKPGKTLIPTFMSFSPGSKAQQSKPKPLPLPPSMLLQYTNETAIYLSLILIPLKSFVQPANDTLCNILWQNNSQVRSSSHLVSVVFTEVRVLKTVEHGFTQPAKAENWCVDWLLSSGVQAADWAVEALVLFSKDVHGKAAVFLQFILAHWVAPSNSKDISQVL